MRGWTPREYLYVGPTGFRLARSDFTLDDLEGSEIKVIFLTWNVKNGNSYDVGPNIDYTDCHGLHFGWPWKVTRQGHNPLIRDILKTVTDTMLDAREDFLKAAIRFRLAPSDLTLDDLQESKIKVTFLTWNVKNGKNYNVGPMGSTLDDLERLKVKVTNWSVTAIGMWGYTPVGITGVLLIVFYFILHNCQCVTHAGWNSNLTPPQRVFYVGHLNSVGSSIMSVPPYILYTVT